MTDTERALLVAAGKELDDLAASLNMPRRVVGETDADYRARLITFRHRFQESVER